MTVEDPAGWDADLRALTDGLGWLFQRPEPRRVFADFVCALLADVPKKNSWGLAEHAGYATPRPFEHLLDGAVCRALLAATSLARLADTAGALAATCGASYTKTKH